MAPKARPVRTCTGCGQRKEKVQMVRIVADPSGELVPDLKGRLPSRGAYVCPDADCIRKAAAGRLPASLRTGGLPPAEVRGLAGSIAALYSLRVRSMLGQARKSGRLVTGTSLVEGELRRGAGEGWLGLVATDASPEISGRIVRVLRGASVPFRVFMSKSDIGEAVGKSPRSVALVKDAGIAASIEESVDRYRRVLNKGGSDQ
ncbi:MAG: DUF448 domain-containing protein [bacterium]|nr:MAG: DUF448 domain-containing protein [bacterium]